MSGPNQDDDNKKGIGAHLTWIVLGVVLVSVLVAALTILLR